MALWRLSHLACANGKRRGPTWAPMRTNCGSLSQRLCEESSNLLIVHDDHSGRLRKLTRPSYENPKSVASRNRSWRCGNLESCHNYSRCDGYGAGHSDVGRTFGPSVHRSIRRTGREVQAMKFKSPAANRAVRQALLEAGPAS
jgi:hypothetical protein